MASEKFSLRWNDFESRISRSLGELRSEGELLDVTLSCGEEQVKAHRLILSACSPVLRKIVNRTPALADSFIYLRGIRFEDLLACLDFMYQGEANVAQEDLNSFLAAAEELQVRGLTQEASKKKESIKKGRDQPSARVTPKMVNEETLKRQDAKDHSIKSEPKDHAVAEKANSSTMMTNYLGCEVYQEDDYTDYNNDDLDYELDNPEQTKDSHNYSNLSVEDLSQYVISDNTIKEYQCALCDTFRAKLPSKVRNHLEAIHFPGVFLYTCNICNKTLKGRNALNIHKSTLHSRKAS